MKLYKWLAMHHCRTTKERFGTKELWIYCDNQYRHIRRPPDVVCRDCKRPLSWFFRKRLIEQET
jgi:hypothetical protein